MRFFNTAGPIFPQDHYYVPHRLNEKSIRQLIEQKKYFVMHAPRQSGKTTAILALTEQINQEGDYLALYVNIEPAQATRNNIEQGVESILNELKSSGKIFCPQEQALFDLVDAELRQVSVSSLKNVLQDWASVCEKPIILFLDEIDSLVGDTLISVLRQLRAGYNNRPKHFPNSICLIGVRDIRDYPIWSEEKQSVILGGSAFNISAESLIINRFSLEQVADLYGQHTRETGQIFEPDAIQYAFFQTQGQPWLVNALAYDACFRQIEDRTQSITKSILEKAKENLILRRDTHLDVLVDRLSEPRVRTVMSAILLGDETLDCPQDDLSYVIDLGLIRRDEHKNLVIANPIYQEVIPRELTHVLQASLTQQTAWYVNSDGTLDMNRLLEAFTQFYRENSEILLANFAYREAGPQLIMMAFLQRIINGGGQVRREYALGRRRADLLVEFKNQRFVIELKIRRDDKTQAEGLKQTADYMDKNGSHEGHLILFDPRKDRTWEQKIFQETHTVGPQSVKVWGL